MKRILHLLLFASLLVCGLFLVNILIFVRTPSGETPQSMVVERGTPLNEIVRELTKRGVIANIPFFKFYILMNHAATRIRAGDYLFPAKVQPREVLALLLKGDFVTHRITIPEGWTAREIAQHLATLHLVNADLFLTKCADPELIRSLGLDVPNLEGYLFPDTYEIYRPRDEAEILRRLVDRFKEVTAKEFEARTRELGRTQQEVVTLASIIEKETGKKEERPLVASVLWNRLKRGIPLATDPTIIYGASNFSGNFSGNLTREDLTRPGPYNSYLNVGLPPTPISNPGKDSIHAALYPAETDYLYFVSKNDGTHYFSQTAEEHTEAVQRYQREKRP